MKIHNIFLLATLLSIAIVGCESKVDKAAANMCECLDGNTASEYVQNADKDDLKDLQECIAEAQKKNQELFDAEEIKEMSSEERKDLEKDLKEALKNSPCGDLTSVK